MDKRSPLEICILIHYYTSCGDYRNLDAPAIKSAIQGFVELGLLIDARGSGDYFAANRDAIKPYIEALCSVPLPYKKWVV